MALTLGGASLLLPAGRLLAADTQLTPTPRNAEGPFYPVRKPADQDALAEERDHHRRPCEEQGSYGTVARASPERCRERCVEERQPGVEHEQVLQHRTELGAVAWPAWLVAAI